MCGKILKVLYYKNSIFKTFSVLYKFCAVCPLRKFDLQKYIPSQCKILTIVPYKINVFFITSSNIHLICFHLILSEIILFHPTKVRTFLANKNASFCGIFAIKVAQIDIRIHYNKSFILRGRFRHGFKSYKLYQ